MLTPVPDPCHTGWKKQHCGSCHTLPVQGHFVDRVPDCAGCHGGNGACRPDDPDREHRRSDDCMGCHEGNHGYTDNADCTICHFADQGVVDCN
jgi:hypothetical protein